MIRVYFASKLHHAERWKAMCDASPDYMAYARWLKHHLQGTPDDKHRARDFWLEDEQDVKDADVVVVYGEDGDHLRGALVEAGMAIAYSVPVIVVGNHPDYGTWQHHPLVKQVPNLEACDQLLKQIRAGFNTMHERKIRARFP